jgi:hypothetical protein
MPFQQSFLVCDNTSLANFKAWAQAISSWFTTAGWTQTADTGQVNWSTISSVPAAGTFVYEMWQPSDALQTGSTAYYVKIQYGTGTASPAGPRCNIQIGLGTNGSGTLTGFTTLQTDLSSGATGYTGQGSLPWECDFAGASDYIAVRMWFNVNSSPGNFFFTIERTKNPNGTDSGDGVNLIVGNITTVAFPQYQNTLTFNRGVTNLPGARAYLTTSINSNPDNFGNNVPVLPVLPDYGVIGNPLVSVCLVPSNNIQVGVMFTTVLYGTTMTFVCIAVQLLSPNYASLCMRVG